MIVYVTEFKLEKPDEIFSSKNFITSKGNNSLVSITKFQFSLSFDDFIFNILPSSKNL